MAVGFTTKLSLEVKVNKMKEFIVKAQVSGRGTVRAKVKAPDEMTLREQLEAKGWMIEAVTESTIEIVEEAAWSPPKPVPRPVGLKPVTFPASDRFDRRPIMSPNNSSHELTPFSPGLLVFLHFITFSIFPLIHLLMLHSRLPKNREDDPSGGKAVGLCFVPFYAIYWTPFALRRLVFRINEQRELLGLSPSVSDGFVLANCILFMVPYLNLLAFVFIMPVFFGYVQSSINELVDASRDRR